MGAHTIASLPAEITATPHVGLSETSAKLIALYREGWAEANWQKIFTATALDYRFDDPLVAEFSRWSLPAYFERLRANFARAGAIAAKDFAFVLSGPMDGPARRGCHTFFREAPRLGLSGLSVITIGARGVIAERVAYDLNPATELLSAAVTLGEAVSRDNLPSDQQHARESPVLQRRLDEDSRERRRQRPPVALHGDGRTGP